jgi:hypothetical protein
MKNPLEITKKALENQIVILQEKQQDLRNLQEEVLINRMNELFGDVLKDFPEVQVKITNEFLDAIYFNSKREDGRLSEILSISHRSYGSDYLNTYATTLDTEFEFRRLVFNGRIAEKFLADSELFTKIFVPTEHAKLISEIQEEAYQTKDELKRIEHQIKSQEIEEKKQRLMDGETIEFEEPKTIAYGSARNKKVNRVIAMKAKWTSKKKVDVTFICKNWDERQPDYEYTREGIHEDYILNAI